MKETERQAQLKQLLADGVRIGLVYEAGAYWMTGFTINSGGAVTVCCRVKVEWLLDGGGFSHTDDGREVPPPP